jgi:hypothetical protein
MLAAEGLRNVRVGQDKAESSFRLCCFSTLVCFTARKRSSVSEIKMSTATMTSFKNPSFQDRARQAADAKEKALDQLRLRPDPDEEIVALRKAAGARREGVQAKKAAAKKAAAEAAAKAKGKARARAAAPVPTEAERKAARDARYAARQARR